MFFLQLSHTWHYRGSAYFWTYLIILRLWDLSICHSALLCHSADGNSRCLTSPCVPTLPASPPPSHRPLHHGLPVHQSIICRAVVLNLVHPDTRDVALRWPADHSRRGGQLGDHHPPVVLVVALGVIARFGGGGDVWEAGVLTHVARVVNKQG